MEEEEKLNETIKVGSRKIEIRASEGTTCDRKL